MSKDNHHFVPQGYLRGFTIDGEKSLVWEYDKETGGISKQPKSVRDICCQHHYYAQKHEDGTVDHESMENAFNIIEDKTPRIIRNIKVNGSGEKVAITDEQKVILSYFAAIQFFRVPNFRNGIEMLHQKMAEMTLHQIVDEEKRAGKLPQEIEELIKRDMINIEVDKMVSLEPMINLAEKGCDYLLSKVWHFAVPAEGMTFVTSDNPIFFQAPEEYREQVGNELGPMHPASELTLPLRKDLLLIFSPSIRYTKRQTNLLNNTSVILDKADTKNINKRTTWAAERYVYSSEKSKALARMVGKFKNAHQKFTL